MKNKNDYNLWLIKEINEQKQAVKGSHKKSESKDFIKGRLYTLRRCLNKSNSMNKVNLKLYIMEQ